MREGSMDKVNNKILQRYSNVADLMANQLKGLKPFATERFSPEQRIWAVDNLGYEDMTDLVNEFGMDAVGYMLAETEKLRQRRNKSLG
jgi:hypothetical protein